MHRTDGDTRYLVVTRHSLLVRERALCQILHVVTARNFVIFLMTDRGVALRLRESLRGMSSGMLGGISCGRKLARHVARSVDLARKVARQVARLQLLWTRSRCRVLSDDSVSETLPG